MATRDFNRRITNDRFLYATCTSCGLWFLTNPPSSLARFYENEYYAIPDRAGLIRSASRERYQLETLLSAIRPPGRVVEIGAAWGVFAWQAARAGFEVCAIEMDARCCQFLRDVVGVDVIHTDRPAQALAQSAPSAAVVMWQVLEHLDDPLGVLDAAICNLMPGGIVLVATPNPDSLGLRLMRSRWPHLDAPRHLTLLPPAFFRAHMQRRGLEEVLMTDTDLGAVRWNRFAWQRLLLNGAPLRLLRIPLLVAGAVLSAAARPWESTPGNGSSYTAIFRKPQP